MIPQLYKCFQHWTERGTVWIISDTHFSDKDLQMGIPSRPTDEELIKKINSKVGKHDTLIILGDCGNRSCIAKLKGYKVLICGNHDIGHTEYERKIIRHKYDVDKYTYEEVIVDMNKKYPNWKISASKEYNVSHSPFVYYYAMADNQLFDEVYSGPLVIGERIILSHEPLEGISWAFNFHGHNHASKTNDIFHYNVCCDIIDYTPINFNQILKSGILSKINNIHRQTINKATDKKKKIAKKDLGKCFYNDEAGIEFLKNLKSHYTYETGIEKPEILGSGSQFYNVFTTNDEIEALKEYNKNRNYLIRISYQNKRRIVEYYDDETKEFKKEY